MCASAQLSEVDYSMSLPLAVPNVCFSCLFQNGLLLSTYFIFFPTQSEWDLYSVQEAEHHPGAFAKLFGLPDAS